MKLPKQLRNELISGLLPLLLPVKENTEVVKKVEGQTLIYRGIKEDQKGNPIKPGIEYVFRENVQVSVNHKRRILEIIDRAKTQEGMQEDLARYLVKFGISKETITESIPEHLRTKQI